MPVRYLSDSVARLSSWPDEIAGVDARDRRARVLAHLGWRLRGAGERKLLDEFLLARARTRCPRCPAAASLWLAARGRIVRPPVDSLTLWVATARDGSRPGLTLANVAA